MGNIQGDDAVASKSTLRPRRTRHSYRGSLRARAPQVDSPLDDPETSDDDDDEDDDGDQDTTDSGSGPPVVTLTHAPPPQDTTLPSQTDSLQADPTQTNPTESNPTETSGSSETEASILSSSEGTRSIPSTTFLSLTSDTPPLVEGTETTGSIEVTSTTTGPGEETGPAVPDSEVVGDEANAGGTNRGADIGIVIGCLAFAALLIVGAVFGYRWYSKRKAGAAGLTRPPSSGSDTVGFVPSGQPMQEEPDYPPSGHPGLQRWNSWARFDSRPSASQGLSNVYAADDGDSDLGWPVHDPADAPPSLPPTVYDSYRR